MFKLSKLWPDLRRRADAPPTFQTSNVWLGIAFALGALCAPSHSVAAAGR